jgi:dienelactone hydrolase
MKILWLCGSLLWSWLAVASPMDAAQEDFNSSRDISVSKEIQKKSIAMDVYHIENFSTLLGKSPMPKERQKAYFLLYQPPKNIRGVLVISPSSEGVRDHLIGRHVRHFLSMGYAVALVDSYRMRGHPSVMDDQSLVTLPEKVMDLILVIQYLEKQSTFKGLPIGAFGVSRGGEAIEMLLDERVFKTFQVDMQPVKWACVLYPGVQIAYEDDGFQPLKIPHLMIIAQKDDRQSPQLGIEYAEFVHSKNPKLQKMVWLDGAHYLDAPFEKTWFPKAISMLHVPVVRVNADGQFIYKKGYFENWKAVVAFWKPHMSQGVHYGQVNDSHLHVMTVIEQFVNVVDGR